MAPGKAPALPQRVWKNLGRTGTGLIPLGKNSKGVIPTFWRPIKSLVPWAKTPTFKVEKWFPLISGKEVWPNFPGLDPNSNQTSCLVPVGFQEKWPQTWLFVTKNRSNFGFPRLRNHPIFNG